MVGGRRWREDRYVMAILEATVRSLSSFALFLLKACCRQSSMFVHE